MDSLASSGKMSVQEVGQLGFQWPKVSTGRGTAWLAVARGQYRERDSMASSGHGERSVQEEGQFGFQWPEDSTGR